MEHGSARLTVYFEDPFWVGVYQREEGGRLEACKLTFGAEPRDCEVYDLLLTHWRELKFSPGVDAGERRETRFSPKKMQRKAAAELERPGAGTKAQQALQLQREQLKKARRERKRTRDAAEEERRFRLR